MEMIMIQELYQDWLAGIPLDADGSHFAEAVRDNNAKHKKAIRAKRLPDRELTITLR